MSIHTLEKLFLKEKIFQVKNELINFSELNLRNFLNSRLEMLKNHPEFQEEKDYLENVAKECFGDSHKRHVGLDR